MASVSSAFLTRSKLILGIVVTIVTATASGIGAYYVALNRQNEINLRLSFDVAGLKSDVHSLRADLEKYKDSSDARYNTIDSRLRAIEQSTARIEALLTQKR